MTSIGSQLQERHLVGVAVDGIDIPLNLTNVMQLQVTESVSQRVPACRFVYKDTTAFLHDTAPISDGSKLGIIMHSGNPGDPESPQDMTFLITGSGADPKGSCLEYRIAGALDHVKYLAGLAKMPMNDTSKGALAKIAQQSGLKFEGDSTSDKMPWLPKNQSTILSDFANTIALHGYSGKKSTMSLGVTDDSRLLYKDLSAAITKSGGRTIKPFATADLRGGEIPYVNWKVTDINGFANLKHGQGVELVQEQMTGIDGIFNLIESLFSGEGLNVSKDIGKLLGGSVLKEFIPVDMKNHGDHKNFYQAKNQNIRGTQLFSNIVEVLTTQATGLHIYDSVYFEPVLPQTNKIATLYAGNYVVSARTRYIEKKTYWEKIRLQSNSGGKGGSGMVGGS